MAKLYRKGGPSQGEPAQVQAEAGLLRVRVGEESLLMPYERLRGRIGGYEDAWIVFELEGKPGVELWLEPDFVRQSIGAWKEGFTEPFLSHYSALVGRHGRRGWLRWAVRGSLLLAFGAFMVWFFSGGLVASALDAIPYSLEAELGDSAAESFASQTPVCSDPALNERLTGILDSLVEQLDEVNYDYRVRILKSEEVNAFALPGGELFFYSGLLEEAESPHEVAAVMGHEIHHAVQRHGLKGMLQSAGTRVLALFLLGGASDGAQIFGGYASKLGQLKFGRDQEREADELGVRLMVDAGFDAGGAISFFGKLAEQTGDSGGSLERMASMASTHPASTERQERLRELATRLQPGWGAQELDTDWKKLRMLCSAAGP